MNKPEEQYGYILIDTPERRQQFQPKLATDEYFSESRNGWYPVVDQYAKNQVANTSFIWTFTYRRKIDPGEGFEIIPFNTVIGFYNMEDWEAGFLGNDGVIWWIKTDVCGCHSSFAAIYGKPISGGKQEIIVAMRRPKQSPVKPKDVHLETMCKILDDIMKVKTDMENILKKAGREPEKTACEKAWDKYAERTHSIVNYWAAKSIFEAGWKAGGGPEN